MSTNLVEQYKTARDGLDIAIEIQELAARHGGWETLDPGQRERLKWVGAFFRKPTPGQFMVRVRITNGQTNVVQLRALASLAQRLGNGVIDLTTRQQVQLRAIGMRDLPDVMEALEGIDLTSLQTGMDNVRNVTSCPLSGVTSSELLDASPIGMELTRTVLRNKAFTNLPRKLNVVITGCTENCSNAETQDISLTPAVRAPDGSKGFNVAVGGKMGSGGMALAQPLDVFVEPHEASRLMAAIILLFRDEGFREERSRNRLAFLVEAWGIDRVRETLERRWGRPLEKAGQDARASTVTDHLGVCPQGQPGLFSVGLCVPTGRVASEQVAELARLAEEYGDGRVRLTPQQNVVLLGVPSARLPRLLEEPLLEEFSPDPHAFFRGLVTCTGTDYCSLALIDTKVVARRVTDAMVRLFPRVSATTMHWSGCPSGCGGHQAADIGFLGARTLLQGKLVDAVSIFVGGRTGAQVHPGTKTMEIVPEEMLDETLPFIIRNLARLKGGAARSESDQQVVMVPAFAKS